MNLPSDTPRLPKWVFFLGWAGLMLVAWYVYDEAGHHASHLEEITVVTCVALAAGLIAYPFVTDYARKQDEALDNRQRALQALASTVASSAEQIAIATAGLQKLTGIAGDNVAQSERAAQQIQERIAELRTLVAGGRKDDGEAVARLEAVAKKVTRAVSEFEAAASRAVEAARAAPPAPYPSIVPELPPVPPSTIVEVKPTVSSSHAPFSVPAPKVEPAPEAAPAPEPVAEPAPAPAAETPAPEAQPPPRKRSPRKPPAAPPPEAPADLVLESPAPDESPPEVPEPAVSADGATRLVVTAYIGIGNRLFIRGEGPGLSWEKGVPLTFVSIGKWRWETNDATAPVRFKLYKNDETESSGLGERSVSPGAQQELTASF